MTSGAHVRSVAVEANAWRLRPAHILLRPPGMAGHRPPALMQERFCRQARHVGSFYAHQLFWGFRLGRASKPDHRATETTSRQCGDGQTVLERIWS